MDAWAIWFFGVLCGIVWAWFWIIVADRRRNR